MFETRWSAKRTSVKNTRRMMTCSVKCAKERKITLEKSRTTCVVCGGPKNSRHAITCSPECKTKRKSETAKNKQYNLCVYDAPHQDDYANMIDILERKGYAKAEDTKEKWTYSTIGYPTIKWVDRVARGVVVSRETGSGKEQ